MKKIDVKVKTKEELHALLKENHDQLRRLYFDLKLGKLQDTSALKRMKKDIARILNVLHMNHGESA